MPALFAQETIKPQKMYEISGQKTSVEIFANIPDANVYLNGVFQGRTNLEIVDLTSGYYQLLLEKSGYTPLEHVIFIKPHYGQHFFLEMKKSE